MSSTSVQLAHSRNMGLYEPTPQFSMWKDVYKVNTTSSIVADASPIMNTDESSPHKENGYAFEQPAGQSDYDDESSRLAEKIKRRLAQNREAARKSRMRKKVYVQQLESSRRKLAQVEQELERAKHQNLIVGSALNGNIRHIPTINTEYIIQFSVETEQRRSHGIATFEIEYRHWTEEQERRTMELRIALQANISDIELKTLVEGLMNHYYGLFRMKANVAETDVFYLMSGTWKKPVERFFLWIGGFRPSELLDVVKPHLEPLTEEQQGDIKKLRHASQQAEYALTQGLEKLQQTLGQIIRADDMSEALKSVAIEKLHAIECFVSQADYVREQALQLMYKILTTHQAARGLLALGDYFHRLSALSSLWINARPLESA
ncbi:hypothetical protein V2J09_001502 [Rumex salicifolius]